MVVKESGKRHMTEGVELPNQVIIGTLGEKETCKYLGILEADTIKQVYMKEKIEKEYLKRTRKLLETKPCQRDKYLRCPPRKMLGTILEMDQKKT